MARYLLIAEKPSLMREIQACYGRHRREVEKAVGKISFASLAGHACRYAEPDEYPRWKGAPWESISYPMIPEEWAVRPIPGKEGILEGLREESGKADGIIVATDSDVEGYGIYWLVERCLGITGKPALRFVEHSLTDGEILSSLLSMTDYHEDPVHVRAQQSFLVRSRADWLFGMNASRLMSVRQGETMRVGRVKAPTIRLIHDNSLAIERFAPRTYFVDVADYGSFKGVLGDENGRELRFDRSTEIKRHPLEGTVESVRTKRARTRAPRLFDLTTAQAEAGRLYGFKPDHTLSVIQSLYEKHKVISYPRTQCKCVSSEKAGEFGMMLGHMAAFPDLLEARKGIPDGAVERAMKDKSLVNDGEVAKESHDALLPTSRMADPSAMTEDERKICHMIYARFLCQFLPDAEEDGTTAVIRHGDGLFFAKGRVIVRSGWRALFSEARESFLPALKEGQKIKAAEIAPEQRTTKAPRRLTQHALINAMESIASLIEDKALRDSLAGSKGIGTSATRAGIIKEILDSGYAEDRKDGLYITDAGRRYVESLSGTGIDSPEFAAVMDTKIKRVQRGEASFDDVYAEVLKELETLCGKMGGPRAKGGAGTGLECPLCGSEIMAGRHAYECSGEGCGFRMGRTVCGREITTEILKAVLSGEPTEPMSFKSKAGKKFTARLALKDGKAEFDFSSGRDCPMCGAPDLRMTGKGAFCDACGMKVFRETFGTRLTDAQFERLLSKGETGEIKSFVSRKTGRKYSGVLYLDKETGRAAIRFPR